MGFCAGAKDELMNNRAIFGTMEKLPQLTADLIPGVIGKKVQGGAEEEYQHHDSLPEDLKMLKPMTAFQRRDCWIWSTGCLRGVMRNQKQAFNGLIWSPCPRQGFQCHPWGVWDVFSPGISPFLNKTQWSMCVCPWRTGTVSPVTSPSITWSRMMLRTKSSRLSTTDGQKGRRKVLGKRRRGYEKKQVEKEGVSHEPGGFSTRFVFFLVYFIAYLSSLKLCCSALVRHQNTIWAGPREKGLDVNQRGFEIRPFKVMHVIYSDRQSLSHELDVVSQSFETLIVYRVIAHTDRKLMLSSLKRVVVCKYWSRHREVIPVSSSNSWKRNGLDVELYPILFSPYLGENCDSFDAVCFVQLLIVWNAEVPKSHVWQILTFWPFSHGAAHISVIFNITPTCIHF